MAKKYEANIVALDISPKLITKQKEFGFSNAVCGSATDLPFGDNIFDFVISSECIEHTSDPIKAIEEMIQVLKVGGIVVLSTDYLVWKWSVYLADFLKIRKFKGVENWTSRIKTKQTFKRLQCKILPDEGLHILPFQIKSLHSAISFINMHGQFLRGIMITQCWVARKDLCCK